MIGAESSVAPPPSSGNGARGGGRLTKRDRDDKKLLEAMKSDPGASIADLAEAVGKSKTSIVSGLHRLRDADLVVNENRKWVVAEEAALRDPPPRWTKPLSGAERAHSGPPDGVTRKRNEP
jgi:hypothetical protein